MATTCGPAALMKARGSVWKTQTPLKEHVTSVHALQRVSLRGVLRAFNPRRKRRPLRMSAGARELTVGTVAPRSCRRVGPSGWVLIKQQRQSATSQPGTATITHQEPEDGSGGGDRVTSWYQLRVQETSSSSLQLPGPSLIE